jgi:transposase
MDIAQQDFKACLSVINTEQQVKVKASRSFENNKSGFTALLAWVNKHTKEALPVSFVMEATGVYYEQLAWFLHQQDCACSVLLPNHAKSYLASVGLKSKNDKIDAQGLSRLGTERALPLWQPLSAALYVLRSLTRLHESLTQQRTALNNQLHATQYSMYDLKEVQQGLKATLKAIDKQLCLTEQQIKHIILDDEYLADKYHKISRIKGVGLLSFAVIVAETNGFALFHNQAQLVSYAGYDVVENQSGKRVGKTRISKRGNAHIRRVLYMPALCVVTHQEPALKALYDRVYQRTGIKMKGYVAVQKKLLCLIYALWKKDQAYDPAYCTNSETILPSNEEPEALLSVAAIAVGSEKNQKAVTRTKKVALTSRATQDELPCNESPEAPLSVKQRY